MRVEVEIGTMEVDALPAGVTVEGLRATVVKLLEARLHETGLMKYRLGGEGPGDAAPRKPGFEPARSLDTLRLADKIGRALRKEIA